MEAAFFILLEGDTSGSSGLFKFVVVTTVGGKLGGDNSLGMPGAQLVKFAILARAADLFALGGLLKPSTSGTAGASLPPSLPCLPTSFKDIAFLLEPRCSLIMELRGDNGGEAPVRLLFPLGGDGTSDDARGGLLEYSLLGIGSEEPRGDLIPLS